MAVSRNRTRRCGRQLGDHESRLDDNDIFVGYYRAFIWSTGSPSLCQVTLAVRDFNGKESRLALFHLQVGDFGDKYRSRFHPDCQNTSGCFISERADVPASFPNPRHRQFMLPISTLLLVGRAQDVVQFRNPLTSALSSVLQNAPELIWTSSISCWTNALHSTFTVAVWVILVAPDGQTATHWHSPASLTVLELVTAKCGRFHPQWCWVCPSHLDVCCCGTRPPDRIRRHWSGDLLPGRKRPRTFCKSPTGQSKWPTSGPGRSRSPRSKCSRRRLPAGRFDK